MSNVKSKIRFLFNFINSHRKLSVIFFVVVLLLIFVFRPKDKVVILTQEARQGDLVKSLSITGTIKSQSVVNLTFQSGGTVNYLGAKEGESVYVGQAIVSLDKQKLEASFRQAQQDFIAAKAASEQYYSSHTNATESYDEKVKRTALDAAQNKAYDQMIRAQKDLNDSTLYSPIEGVLTKSGVTNTGVNITSTTAFTITNPDYLDFEMDVDEADIGNVRLGQEILINLDSYPNETIKVNVTSIDFVTHTTATGGSAYTVKANLVTDNKNYKYRVGMNGNAEIILKKVSNTISIPLSSLFDSNKVYVKIGIRYEPRTLTLGLENDTDVEVIKGINPGELVVLDPTLIKL